MSAPTEYGPCPLQWFGEVPGEGDTWKAWTWAARDHLQSLLKQVTGPYPTPLIPQICVGQLTFVSDKFQGEPRTHTFQSALV